MTSLYGEILRIHGVFRIAVDPASPHFGGASHVWGDWSAQFDDANVSQTQATVLTIPLTTGHFNISQDIGATSLGPSHMEVVLNFNDEGVFESATVRRIAGVPPQDSIALNYFNYELYYSQFTPPGPIPPPPPLLQSIVIASDPNGGVVDMNAMVNYTILSGSENPLPDIASVTNIDLGSELLGNTSSAMTLIICNNGFASLIGISTGLVGPASTEYVVDDSLLGTTLAPGECKTVTLTFSPVVTGSRNATLQIHSNDPDENPYETRIGGEGISPFAVTQAAYVKSPEPKADSFFGVSVAIYDKLAVVGSSGTGADGSGQAHVYVRDGDGQWHFEATLKPSNGENNDRFGCSVAIYGETVVVGAEHEDSNSTVINSGEANNIAINSGAAYVFVRSGSTWSQQAYLKASSSSAGSLFGGSVSISQDTIVVGARNVGELGTTNIPGSVLDGYGEAYVFVRNGVTWTQQTTLTPPSVRNYVLFGTSVSVSGDLIAVGSPRHGGDWTNSGAGAPGAVHIFVRDSQMNWSHNALLEASNKESDDSFGESVSVSVTTMGNTIAVGAPGEDGGGAGINSLQSSNSRPNSGAAYVFVLDTFGQWVQEAYIKPSNPDAGDKFGTSVSVSDNHLIVGSPLEDSSAVGVDGCDPSDNSDTNSGAAYIFKRTPDPLGNPGTWHQKSYLKASNTNTSDGFGTAVAIDDDVAIDDEDVIIGAPFEDSNASEVGGNQLDNSFSNAGAAYIYRNPVPVTNAMTLYDSAVGAAGLIGNNAQPQAVPFGDNTTNLSKYAFNMDLSGYSNSIMTPGGTSGLPWAGLVDIDGQAYWRLEYLIRTGSSLDYRPVKSTNLQPGCFEPMTGEKTVTVINSNWSRVIIDEPIDPSSTAILLFRIEVSIP